MRTPLYRCGGSSLLSGRSFGGFLGRLLPMLALSLLVLSVMLILGLVGALLIGGRLMSMEVVEV